MSRPILSICTRCEGGERLHDEVKALRRERGLKELFKVDDVSCLNCCDDPIAIELQGSKRSTYTRMRLPPNIASVVVDAAVAYCRLQPDEELPERLLPGEEG